MSFVGIDMTREQKVLKAGVFILTFLLFAAQAASQPDAEFAHKYLLPDGLVLGALDGKLVLQDSNENAGRKVSGWSFELAADAGDGRGVVKAGQRLQLLPSAALEKMAADAKKHSRADYRLRARITKYRGENFIFATGFLYLGESSRPQPPAPQSRPGAANSEKEAEREPTVNESNDMVAIPEEVLSRLRTLRTTPAVGGSEGSENRFASSLDYTITERSGLFAGSDNTPAGFAGQSRFVVDGLGRNLPDAGFFVLPCEARERTEAEQSATLERPRFKIAGIVTRYQGKDYLLLQKAIRLYSYGNFPK